jgi:hypothetical protein
MIKRAKVTLSPYPISTPDTILTANAMRKSIALLRRMGWIAHRNI